MKILHTADWHIGKRLHKYDLSADFILFIDWLVALVKKENIELLLVSGDIFDLANPSSEARRIYFETLLKFQRLNCKLILTGGNHDSPAVLNGPKDLLQAMDIHVVGNLPEEIEDCLIPIRDQNGKAEILVAALPYLRDPDLRNASEEYSYENRVEAIRQGIANVFENAAQACAEKYPDVPAIAMGHLFAAGVSTSESERDIQVGNEASFNASHFGDYFHYIALGHIHRPQSVKASCPTYYSGSPIPLSFSERKDQKRVLILDTQNFEVESIDVPIFRELKTIKGTLEQIRAKLDVLQIKGNLDTLLEVALVEEEYNPASILELDHLVRDFDVEGAEIVKHRADFKSRVYGSAELYDSTQELEDLKPAEVFEKRLEKESFDQETENLVREAFLEVLEEVQSTEAS